jgi:hypothetical protein
MSINKKMTGMVILNILILSSLFLIGRHEMASQKTLMNKVVQEEFIPLIDKEILPLLEGDVSALVNQDFPQVAKLNNSWILLLEADRDVHQALIAEKEALGSTTSETLTKAGKDNTDNIAQAKERMEKAAAVYKSAEDKALYQQFLAAFET